MLRRTQATLFKPTSTLRSLRNYTDDASYIGLTAEQKEFYDTNGYLHIRGALSDDVCDALRFRAIHHLAQFDPNAYQKSIFSSTHQTRFSDSYFLESGHQIRYFFEEKAFDDDGNLAVPVNQAINKIGHNLHSLDPAFRAVSFSPHVIGILKSLGYIKPVLPQSMYIFKQPSIGGEVLPHQDGTYLYTEPQSVVGFWWALEDCTTMNGMSNLDPAVVMLSCDAVLLGCLYGVAGSHKTTPVQQRFLRTTPYDGQNLTADKDAPLLTTSGQADFDTSQGRPILTKKGDLVLLHNAFVHYSHANTSLTSRHAYTIHAVETHETDYPATNWLQFPPGMTFPPLFATSTSASQTPHDNEH
ncbi:hypothetical protein DYB30_001095 [Aphanomyces astaci]|uniref:Phytanoyl-CoA dioxygenase n=1 Tax=Aphanomyces astaci TaxID=112090 RepID=A0A397DGV0_APHAT|nr:hypothetical protein DYB36_000057 [Aphanomyces astaci]RHY62072.1 hypothetical protein DYB38_001535 [Aphanomyces astaci]RHY65018.1 hypothetical protein DYB30_001095 [Aphanomyces astaci]RHY65113.1 hypothetical protein DYB34_002882 [Aphanomyces astaci]RHY81219.1 hypothetical protein DYB26_001880 [Aphanomyces astaci]